VVPNANDRTYVLWITFIYGIGQTYGGYYTIIDDESSVCLTVDNTPPIVNADINPNTISSIDFSSNRGFKIIARSSSDTKAVYANYLGSDHLLYYSMIIGPYGSVFHQ